MYRVLVVLPMPSPKLISCQAVGLTFAAWLLVATPFTPLTRRWPNFTMKPEARFDDALVTVLATAVHNVEVLSEAFSDTMGHAGGIVHHPLGLIESAHDPRANDGAASV